MSLNGYYDVTTNGADPTGVSPSNSAIQITLNQCATSTHPGGVVWFPPGTYLVNATGLPLTIGTGVEIRGAAAGATTILTAATSGAAPTILYASMENHIAIRDLAFEGNDEHAVSAPPVIQFFDVIDAKVDNCMFTKNFGETINFSTSADGEVKDCYFSNVGYASYRSDAIFVDSESLGVQIHNNFLTACQYGGINVQGDECDVSHNFLSYIGGNGIYFNGSKTRVALNSVSYVNPCAGSTTAVAIQADNADTFCIIGNNVSLGKGDGIALTDGWSNGIVMANNSWDNGTLSTAGDSNIKVQGVTGSSNNQGLVLVGNNSWSDPGTITEYGIHFTGAGAAAYGAVMANNTYGSISQGIIDDANLLQSDTVTVMGNSDWLERIHANNAPVCATAATYTTLASPSIHAGSMRQNCGIRITATGQTKGTDQKEFNLGFGSNTNILNGLKFTPTATPSTWELLCVVMNNDFTDHPNDSQAAMVMFWGGGSLLQAKEVVFAINTTSNRAVNFQANNATTGANHWVSLDFLTVERC